MNISLWDFISNLFEVVANIGNTLWNILTTPVAQYVATWDLSNIFGTGVIGNWLSEAVYNLLSFLFGENGTLLTMLPVMIGIILIVRLILAIFRG